MNRLTALLLAMAALLVHVLVVHRNAAGAFAAPYDSAHAAYHLGRTLAYEGVLAWSVDAGGSGAADGGLSSYPSPLLVWISAAIERFYFSVTRGAQVVGIACVLMTVFLSTRFDTDRIAGVVPALLLVASGAVAAAGASGTEWPLAMFLLATSFVALEHGRSRFAALALALLAVTRAEAIVAIAVMALQTALRRRSSRETRPVPHPLVFAPAVLAFGLAHALGASFVQDLAHTAQFDARTIDTGLRQLRDFFVATVSPLLLVFPLVALALGELSPVGRRALALAAAWWATAALSGGGPTAFGLAFVPALPIAFIAIQQGIARALDTYRASMERLAWMAIGVGILGSLLPSRFPVGEGRSGLRELQLRWWAAAAEAPPGHSDLVGRSALFEEIRLTQDLRRIGAFLRDRLPEDATVLSPWPGALGYLASVRVVDLFGRTTALPGRERTPWSPEPPRADLRAALATNPDYIVPTTGGLNALAAGDLQNGFPERLFTFDPANGDELRAAVADALAQYEIVVTTGRGPDEQLDDDPLVLLRRRGLAEPPEIESRTPRTGPVQIRAGFDPSVSDTEEANLPQVYDVLVIAERSDGTREVLDPRGRVRGTADPIGSTRSLVGIVLDPRWPAAVSLARIPRETLDRNPPVVRLEARLLHHRLDPSDPAADAAPPLTLPLR